MCCGDCSPIRCPAVPDTDWSAFTWRWRNQQAEAFPYTGGVPGGPIDFYRQIMANDRGMIHPGVCPCLWLVPIDDQLLELPLPGTVYQSPCIGVLQRVGQGWSLTINRWFWGTTSEFWTNGYWQNWNFESAYAGDCGYFGGGSAGWTPYGWNGLGWAYGWGYGWGYWGGSYSTLCGYTLSGKLLTDGSDNVFTQSEFKSNVVDEDSPENWNLPKYWPATVTLSRIPKTGVLS